VWSIESTKRCTGVDIGILDQRADPSWGETCDGEPGNQSIGRFLIMQGYVDDVTLEPVLEI